MARVPAGVRAPLMWLAGLALVVLNVASIAHQTVIEQRGHLTTDRYRIDLDVYRIGATVWRGGRDLYVTMPRTRVGLSLPFTYPPIAAVFLSPLTFVPFAVATVGITLISIAMLAVVVALFLASLGLSGRHLAWVLMRVDARRGCHAGTMRARCGRDTRAFH